MKKLLRLCFALALIENICLAQSAITHQKYFEDPTAYTSNIDTNKIKSSILIDRTIYDDNITNVNGTNKVRSIRSGTWASIYNNIKLSNSNDKTPSLDSIEQQIIKSKNSAELYSLALINFDVKRIKESAIINGDFVQGSTYLIDQKATINSFETLKIFTGTNTFENIYGSKINFTLPSSLYFTNSNDDIVKIEIDFGNGLGFQTIKFNEVVTVDYFNTNNEFIELIFKISFTNSNTLYCRNTFFRKSSSSIPTPSAMPLQQGNPLIQKPHTCGYIPDTASESNYKIEYSFLFNENNKSGKLRRPFIICDGFDHQNKRDYFCTYRTFLDNLFAIDEEKDYRGLYEILNGDPSPWDKTNPTSAHLIDSLLANGFDLVFVNFFDGSGDIISNAKYLRIFLNTVINKQYRDNKTEEIVLVSPSMSGLISRIALTEMEKANENHFVKIWISYDSPHKGANIPIALQHNIDYGCGFAIYGKSFQAKRDMLNSTAAKQLLKHHFSSYTGISYPAKEHVDLQNYLNSLGFPKNSKNYGITNGGTTVLYPSAGVQIVKFSLNTNTTYLKGWGQNNGTGTYTLSVSNRKFANEVTIKSSNQIAMDNAPGGWHAGLYSINKNFINDDKDQIKEEDINTKWSSFIPTVSSLGHEITANSIHYTWDKFTNCNDNTSGKIKTPFDEIHGMKSNEEHVKISIATSNYVTNEFKEYSKTTVRPIVRSGSIIKENINGKIAYTVTDTILFGNTGNGNTFSIGTTGDVNISAGKSIRFLNGFKVSAGANMSAKIVRITTSPIQGPATTQTWKTDKAPNADPTKASPYEGKTYDYSEKEDIASEIKSELQLNIFPNPAYNRVSLNINGIVGNNAQIEVYNTIGSLVFSEKISNNGTYHLDISNLESGVYFVKVKNEKTEANQRIIKL